MSAISLYVFNHLITEYNPDVSAVFHKVSIVEMHHLEIFGNLAQQLGEEPRLWTQHGCKKDILVPPATTSTPEIYGP